MLIRLFEDPAIAGGVNQTLGAISMQEHVDMSGFVLILGESTIVVLIGEEELTMAAKEKIAIVLNDGTEVSEEMLPEDLRNYLLERRRQITSSSSLPGFLHIDHRPLQ